MFNQMCEACPDRDTCKVPDAVRKLPPEAVLGYELLRVAGVPKGLATLAIIAQAS